MVLLFSHYHNLLRFLS
ncbi:MAG: hypothetical protein ICV60_03710 [Pyrinomonadaceae bacterium]|nr:hypothetical protein [Pyrinomonadaceae bacterium]